MNLLRGQTEIMFKMEKKREVKATLALSYSPHWSRDRPCLFLMRKTQHVGTVFVLLFLAPLVPLRMVLGVIWGPQGMCQQQEWC